MEPGRCWEAISYAWVAFMCTLRADCVPATSQPCTCASMSWRLSSYLTNTALPAGPNRASRSCCLLVVPPCVCVNVSLRARSCERPTVCDIEFRICDSSMTVTSDPCVNTRRRVRSTILYTRTHAGSLGVRLHTRRRVCPYTVCGFCVFAPLSRSAKPKTPKAVPVAHDQTPETSRARRRRNRTRRMRVQSPILLRAHTRG